MQHHLDETSPINAQPETVEHQPLQAELLPLPEGDNNLSTVGNKGVYVLLLLECCNVGS